MVGAVLPKRWTSTLDQWRRDASMLKRRLTGEKPSPVIRMATLPRRSDPVQTLHVARVVRETPHTVTLVLTGTSVFDFAPGQFFTVLASVDGETVPRNYSASNAPGSRELHLTIKRKEGGRVSGALVALEAGAELRVLGPFGQFVVPDTARALVLVAGGAGITPLMSMIRTTDRPVTLLYGNRTLEDVAFAAELRSLADAGRLVLHHVLESPPEGWTGPRGRLDRAMIASLVPAPNATGASEPTFFVCGPDGMREEALAALEGREVHVERFTTGLPRMASSRGGARTIEIVAGGTVHRALALAGATLLEAGLAAGAPMPSSCSVGGCGACRVKLAEGDVTMEEPNCLTDAERRAGYVLACVARPEGPCRVTLEREST